MEYLKQWYTEAKPETVVEFQPGNGSMARLLRPLYPGYWYGVETWAPFVAEHDLWDAYDKVIIADARHLDFDSIYALPDLVILRDVLPHMARDEAMVILNKIKIWTDRLIVSVPLALNPDHGAYNWTYGHQSTLTLDDVNSMLGPGVEKIVADNEEMYFLWKAT